MAADISNQNTQTLLKSWADKGRYTSLRLGEKPLDIFYLDLGSPNASADKTLLILHGFPESSYSFHQVIDGLLQQFERLVLFDMLGYGLSSKPDVDVYSYSLIEQADTALMLWRVLGVEGGHLLSHDMGTSVATEIAYRDANQLLPEFISTGIKSYTFTNGSMMLKHADLRIMQKALLSPLGSRLAQLSRYPLFKKQIISAHGSLQTNAHSLDEIEIKMLWAFQQCNNGKQRIHHIIQYLNDRKRFENIRWLPALSDLSSKKPIHICWGEADQVARVEIARELHEVICRESALTLMPKVGHFCQLGSPETWLQAIINFYQQLTTPM